MIEFFNALITYVKSLFEKKQAAPPVVDKAEPPPVSYFFTGKCSWFGGPADQGVAPGEGLALFDLRDVAAHPDLFLPTQPKGTTGAARRLNPEAHYCACRWDYQVTSRDFLRTHTVLITNLRTGEGAVAQPVDWGPNEKTDRVCDMSLGLLNTLGLKTDDHVRVEIPNAGH